MTKNKTLKEYAFVLGGYGQIGAEICSSLLDKKDINVVVLDIKNKNFFKKNKNFFFEYFDCSDLKNIEKNIKNLFKKYKCTKIFINSSYPHTTDWVRNTFKNSKLSSFKKNVEMHLISSCWILRIVAEFMKKRRVHGSIISFGSIYGFLAQDLLLYSNTRMQENIVYPVIKAGIINYTKQMASYYGKYKIRINTISPGGLEGKISGRSSSQSLVFKKNYKKKTPLNRLATAKDISGAVFFLTSDEASYITGINLIIDGGYSII